MDNQSVWNQIYNWLINTGIKIVIAVFFLFISFLILRLINNRLHKILKRKVEQKKLNENTYKTAVKTILYILNVFLKLLIVACIIAYLGIDTSAITALVGIVIFAITLAVKGVLSNFAGGIMLLITKPFKVDDYISVANYEGTVIDIKIYDTILETIDGKSVHIPNQNIFNNAIINYTEKGIRRLDIIFSIAYNSDIEKAKSIIEEVCLNHKNVLKNPAVIVKIKDLTNNGINLVAKMWVPSLEYKSTQYDMLENVKKAFTLNNIEIPYNQYEVHLLK